jgi:hypothetical protein
MVSPKLSETKDVLLISVEPAQEQASKSFLTRELIGLVTGPRRLEAKPFVGYICKILELLSTQGTYENIGSTTWLILAQLLRLSSPLRIPPLFF